ncbi:glutamate-1-semialdehyde 2,1-aminomutase [Natranaerovirga hydrolytica]|uniref:Glutamate-1-semialdehyde 2,1-aminomutase n=1 Tax=Natranaerovirga hydrolytica TaxID=680378 RepID=A0A4R1MJ48_9FIRM|nr:glutamate-1-semialdehyde 2,1-aminomutase [Natranaerovirga hydrolytica]TCK92467.1 glutamate-1-semialdehyde 2,1-aminomutase [Natranaerovirga hydrolytica]
MNQSKAIFEEAKQYIPGGVNSPVRAFQSVGMDPIIVKEAKGSKIIDVENKEYIDYISSWGPLILGHASDIVSNGIMDYIHKGTSFGLPTKIEVDIAKLIHEAFPSMELIRMVNSGTEATMSALRVARGYTKRNKILKFEGCYHGHSDSLLVKSGSGTLTYGVPTSEGVPQKVVEDTLVGEFNNIENVKQIFKENQNEIAAVIVEPVPGNMGVIPPNKGFLEALRTITKEEGAVLIFDEVITGFRLGFGGAQGTYGIKPDMTCLGKIIGGGLPVGAYGGKKEIMEMVAPLGNVYQAGTLSGNPIAVKMGYNTLNYLKNNQDIYKTLEDKAIILEKAFNEHIEKAGVPARVNRVKSMLTVFFNGQDVVSYQEASTSDTQMYSQYFKGMLAEGILLPLAQFEGMFLSAAHTDEDLEKTIKASKKVLLSL